MTVAAVGLISLVAAGILSACLYLVARRKVRREELHGRRVIIVSALAPFLALAWLAIALLLHVAVSNHLAHQDCGFSPDPYVTLPNGYVVGSLNTYDGYFHAPGFSTDMPVTGPGYVRSLIDLRFSDPYFTGTVLDFNTSSVRRFVFDTRTRASKLSEPTSPGGPCGTTPNKACLDAFTDAVTHAQTDADGYWKTYERYRRHWPNFVLLALILVGEGAIVFLLWKTWTTASTEVSSNACIKMFFDDSTINTFSFAASHSCCCRWMTGNTEIICDGV